MTASTGEVIREAERILAFLASTPSGVSSAERPVVRQIMLSTSGEMLVHGEIFDIVARPLGAGVYQLSLLVRQTGRRPRP